MNDSFDFYFDNMNIHVFPQGNAIYDLLVDYGYKTYEKTVYSDLSLKFFVMKLAKQRNSKPVYQPTEFK